MCAFFHGWYSQALCCFLIAATAFPITKLSAQCGTPISIFPYHEDFEAGAGGWTSGGMNNDWTLGTPAKPTINSAGSGNKCWITGGLTASFYNLGERSYVLSPCFNFTLLSHPFIHFKIFWESENHFDGGNLQYSLDGGASWTNVGTVNDPVNCLNDNWFNYTPINYLTGLTASRDGWSGNKQPGSGSCAGGGGSNGWVTAHHCMPYLGGKPSVRFRFTFGAGTTCNNFDGMAFDDVYVENAPAVGVNFSASCSTSNTYAFTDLSINCPDTWSWNFGDSGSGALNTSTLQNPSHTFPGPGTYVVTLNASSTCSGMNSLSRTIKIYGLTANTTPVDCNGSNTGSVSLQITPVGGNPVYSWNTIPPQSGPTATNLAAGVYTVSVTENGICAASSSVTITEPPPLHHQVAALTAACGNPTGSASIVESGGTGPYTYTWSPSGGNASSATGLTSGNYVVNIKDQHGCLDTVHLFIADLPGVQASINIHSDAHCFGDHNGNAVVNAVNGSMPYQFSWSQAGASGPAVGGLGAGIYTVTVTDASQCTATATVTIQQPPQLVHQTGAIASDCGANDGSASVMESGGNPPYSYIWSPSGGNGSSVSNMAPGNYTVSIYDLLGCTDTAHVSIDALPGVQAVVNLQHNVGCNGGSDGSATVSASGGTLPYSYVWSANGNTNAVVNGLSAGAYYVTVTDHFFCSSIASVTITQPGALNHQVSVAPATCGNNNGNGSILEAGGSPPYSFNWAPSGGTTNTAGGLAAGNYTVQIKDQSGCPDSVHVTISNIPGVAILQSGSVPANCFGGVDGSANVQAGIGILPYVYSWSAGGATGPTASGLSAGLYAVTITDANQCTATASILVSQAPKLQHMIVTTAAACAASNGSATITESGGTGAYTYNWAPAGGTNSIATGLMSGTYIVTVTDQHNCLDTAIVSVGNIGGQTVSVSATTQVGCHGGADGSVSVAVTGGLPPYSYTWLPAGATGPSANGLTAGVYFITVTDANQCVATTNTLLTEPPAFLHTVNVHPVTCNGANGIASILETGGTGTYGYNWSPSGGSGSSGINLTAGNYVVTIQDQHNCQDTVHVTIGNIPVVQASINSASDVTCFGGTNGMAAASAVNGPLPYVYAWAPTGGAGPTASGLPAGIYTVTVTDANLCTATASAVIHQPTTLSHLLTSQDATCGNPNGSVSISEQGGSMPYTYLWMPGNYTTPMMGGLSAGTYFMTVTDAHGCRDTTLQYTVKNQPGVQVSLLQNQPVKCFGGHDGSISVSASIGTQPYQYQWSITGINGPVVSGLNPGPYELTVTDMNGCTATLSASITQPPALAHTETIVPAGCLGVTGSASIAETGGTGPYQFTWMPVVSSGPMATGLQTGFYQVTVLDANGCQDTLSFTIDKKGPVALNFQTLPVRCTGEANGAIYIDSVLGGKEPYAYALGMSSFGASPVFSGLSAGNYIFHVRDSTGCVLTDTISLKNPPVNEVHAGRDTTISAGEQILLTGTVSNPGLIAHIQWKSTDYLSCDTCLVTLAAPPATTAYGLYVTDTSGCVLTDFILIQVTAPPVFIPNVFSPASVYLNDHFTVYAGGNGHEVELMQVYDRWGDLIWEDRQFPASDATHGWDGRARGGPAPAGVYVYALKLRFSDGTSKIYTGDVTLVR
jgi:gliding motility-associated-like protein